MTRKQRRGVLILVGLALIGGAAGLMGWAFQKNVSFFKSPSEVLASEPRPEMRFRLGGCVEAGTLHKGEQSTFKLTDGSKSLLVSTNDILPDLLKEGQSAIVEGHMAPDGVFLADKVLAKHDEKYVPPQVASSLKNKGVCPGDGGKPKVAPGI